MGETEINLRKTVSIEHAWREDVGRCVCCWQWCPRCKHCKCQAKNFRLTECPVPETAEATNHG